MTYVKQVWQNEPNQTTPLSAARLNHLETQFDEAKAYTDSALAGGGDPDARPGVSMEWKTFGSPAIRYLRTTVHAGGSYVPGLVKKSFANGFTGGTGTDLKPVREYIQDAANRTGATMIINATGWNVGANEGEVEGAQILNGQVLHEPSTASWWLSDSIGILPSGEMKCYSLFTHSEGTSKMVSDGVIDSWSYGPTLVRDGVSQNLSNAFWNGFTTPVAGRTVMGQRTNGDVVFLSIPGKSGVWGATGIQARDISVAEGLYQAMNLDGGGSTQCVANGVTAAASSDAWGRRKVADFAYVTVPVGGYVSPDPIPIVFDTGFESHAPELLGGPAAVLDWGSSFETQGYVKRTAGNFDTNSFTVANLPDWLRPKVEVAYFQPGSSTNFRKTVVLTTGALNVAGGAAALTTSNVALSGMRWANLPA